MDGWFIISATAHNALPLYKVQGRREGGFQGFQETP